MSYIPVAKDSHFSLKNIPFGIFSSKDNSTPRPATAIGEFVLDLSILAKEGAFNNVSGFDSSTLQQVTLLLCSCRYSPHSMPLPQRVAKPYPPCVAPSSTFFLRTLLTPQHSAITSLSASLHSTLKRM